MMDLARPWSRRQSNIEGGAQRHRHLSSEQIEKAQNFSRREDHAARESTFGRISPPPLKRRRTCMELKSDATWSASDLPITPLLSSNASTSRRSGFQASSKVGDIPRSHRSTPAEISKKRTCRACERTTTTSFDPIIACAGCSRLYHDSCRKPPLVEGRDPYVGLVS